MQLLRNYLKAFFKRSGSYVFIATIVSRILSFLASWIALQFIENTELGVVLFAYSIIAFLIPIGGFGLHQSLIRYSALLKSKAEKNSLFVYVFKKGILASVIFIISIIIVAHYVPFQFKKTTYYLTLLSFLILPTFVLEVIRAQFRLNHNNKLFSYAEITGSIFLVTGVCTLSFFYKEIGYITALISAPFLTSLFFIKRLNINFSVKERLPVIDFSFWKYGFYAGLSNVVTQLLFVVDMLLIGYLLNDAKMVTNYRYVSLVPFSLLFLPRVFIATDFVSFTENIFDIKYIKNYIKSYSLLFLIISFVMCVFCIVFSRQILSAMSPDFSQYFESFVVLIIGVSGIYIFRGLYGNLLSSIGKANVNYYIAVFALILNIISNYYLIPKYGIIGAAYTTSGLMWVTGFISLACFWYFYKNQLLLKQG